MTKKKANQLAHSMNGKRRFDMPLDEDYFIEEDMLNTSVSENETVEIGRKCETEEVRQGEALIGEEHPEDEDNSSHENGQGEEDDGQEQNNHDEDDDEDEDSDKTDNYGDYWGTRKLRIVEAFSRLSLQTSDGNCDISDEFEQLTHHFSKTIHITSTKTKNSKNKRKPQQTKLSQSKTAPPRKAYNSIKNNAILQGSAAWNAASQQNNMLLQLLLDSHRFSHQQHIFSAHSGTVAIYQGSPLNVLLQNLKNFVNRSLSPSIFKKYQKNSESSPKAISLIAPVSAVVGQKLQDHRHQDHERERIEDKDQEI